ncbi:hypothetical protein EDD15DRAFT_2266034 [Pisolithus albus]|nr:hypothetical protein EDD15DRAFT_2266034 [Pisolithus albus]
MTTVLRLISKRLEILQASARMFIFMVLIVPEARPSESPKQWRCQVLILTYRGDSPTETDANGFYTDNVCHPLR